VRRARSRPWERAARAARPATLRGASAGAGRRGRAVRDGARSVPCARQRRRGAARSAERACHRSCAWGAQSPAALPRRPSCANRPLSSAHSSRSVLAPCAWRPPTPRPPCGGCSRAASSGSRSRGRSSSAGTSSTSARRASSSSSRSMAGITASAPRLMRGGSVSSRRWVHGGAGACAVVPAAEALPPPYFALNMRSTCGARPLYISMFSLHNATSSSAPIR
jgi:hypothetical protein